MKRTQTHKVVWLENDTHKEVLLFKISIDAKNLDKAIRFAIEKAKKLNIEEELKVEESPDAFISEDKE